MSAKQLNFLSSLSIFHSIPFPPLSSFPSLNLPRTKRGLILNGFFPDFDFYGDKVISLVLVTAIAAGIGVSYEIKRGWEEEEEFFNSTALPSERPIIDDVISEVVKFFDRAIIASSVLAVACLCMAIVSVISSINRSRTK